MGEDVVGEDVVVEDVFPLLLALGSFSFLACDCDEFFDFFPFLAFFPLLVASDPFLALRNLVFVGGSSTVVAAEWCVLAPWAIVDKSA